MRVHVVNKPEEVVYETETGELNRFDVSTITIEGKQRFPDGTVHRVKLVLEEPDGSADIEDLGQIRHRILFSPVR